MIRATETEDHINTTVTPTAAAITIRPAHAGDLPAVGRLAALDSADNPPAMPLLLAEVAGELRIALSLRDGAAIADPFFPTVDLLALLRSHAADVDQPLARSSRRRRPHLSFG